MNLPPNILRTLFLVFLAFAVLAFGGVHGPSQVFLHGLLTLIALGVLLSPNDQVQPISISLIVGSLLGGLVLILVGFIPIGDSLLSVSPLETIGALTVWILIAGLGYCLSFWRPEQFSVHLEWVFVVGAFLVIGVALGHLLTDMNGLFGLFAPLHGTPLFVPPMVNANHTASLVVFLLPALLTVRSGGLFLRRGSQVAAFGLLAVLAACLSVGAVVALFGIILWWGLSKRPAWQRGLGFTGAAILCFVGLWQLVEATRTGWEAGSFTRRAMQWWDIGRLLGEAPVWGTGAGTFEAAYAPYAEGYGSVTWTHAHSEPLHWLVEFGWVFVPISLVFIVWFFRLESKLSGIYRGMWYGVFAVLLHSLVDFPLHIPGIAVLVVGALILMLRSLEKNTRNIVSRGWLIGLAVVALVQLPAGAWTYMHWRVDHAMSEITVSTGAERLLEEADAVERWAPWRSESALLRAWAAERLGKQEEAVSHALLYMEGKGRDTDLNRQAALILLRQGRTSEATQLLDRAIRWAPADYRNWAALSWAHSRRGQAGDALESWHAATRHWPPDVGSTPIPRALLLQPIGLLWLETLEVAHPKWSEELGYALLAQGDAETAILAFEQANRLYPTGRDIPHWGRALVMTGRIDEGMAMLDALSEKHPRRPNMPQNKALALEHLGKDVEAASQWVRAAELGMGEDAYRRCYQLLSQAVRGATPETSTLVQEQRAYCRSLCDTCR